MAQAMMYLEYNDPLRIIWRAGTADEPYPTKIDSLLIINNKMVLTEIPSKFHGVKVAGYTEVNEDIYRRTTTLSSNEFYVNYQNGIVLFNPSAEDKTLVAEYKGRGIIQYPAERIYAHNKRKDNVVENLQQIIDDSMQKIEEVYKAIDDVNVARVETEVATTRANIATDNANLARDGAIDAKNQALAARDEALDAAATTIQIYLEPVDTYAKMLTTYPNPINGDRVMIKSTGDIYRYDGIDSNKWELIDNYTGGAVPLASATSSGLMNKDDFSFIHNELTQKSIIFVIPTIKEGGVQKPIIRFPQDGELVSAYAYCNTQGSSAVTRIAIEKLSETGFTGGSAWTSIADVEIPNGMSKGPNATINNNVVNVGDYFRLNFAQVDSTISGITVQLEVKI